MLNTTDSELAYNHRLPSYRQLLFALTLFDEITFLFTNNTHDGSHPHYSRAIFARMPEIYERMCVIMQQIEYAVRLFNGLQFECNVIDDTFRSHLSSAFDRIVRPLMAKCASSNRNCLPVDLFVFELVQILVQKNLLPSSMQMLNDDINILEWSRITKTDDLIKSSKGGGINSWKQAITLHQKILLCRFQAFIRISLSLSANNRMAICKGFTSVEIQEYLTQLCDDGLLRRGPFIVKDRQRESWMKILPDVNNGDGKEMFEQKLCAHGMSLVEYLDAYVKATLPDGFKYTDDGKKWLKAAVSEGDNRYARMFAAAVCILPVLGDEANGQMIVGLEESWLLNKENENEGLNARRNVSEKALSYLPLSYSSNENKDESDYGEKNQSETEENLVGERVSRNCNMFVDDEPLLSDVTQEKELLETSMEFEDMKNKSNDVATS
ncbi:unnamed protein product [Didymodactylos carnosus]|uniref:Uncharacterized protein n=1 Tax=Didymodactylos carnosus TaxID=1234261 RepID=A0A815JAE2_9BILA|nr:unnamed protein product [Didymodactylos carnosus]CAF1379692.1 unnamed protein product [Didymodactylos carnosus]CAF4081314.1 unnamed protein product [Didymodactylos carnosus]CAF4273430.1 unnamed protein product [Didymodactylos carnosus]